MAENFCGKGNASLPIASFKKEIVEAVKNNACVIITAETGSGKSTQVPQYLLETGYRVVVTEPRRLAARSVSERVAEEWGCSFGELIGYRTGDSQDRKDSASTRLLYCTDGLQVVRELTDSGKAEVLVIDEVHEWNLNIETLIAWARKRLNDGDANFKVVIMSATLESGKLSEFFGGAPILNVPGRLFPVEMKSSSDDISSEAKRLVSQGKNVLVFQPGKAEIIKTIADLEGCGAVVLPLHGELTPEEQKKCFRHYDIPKVVVATNVAQTSVTVDDIDAVVDSGIERRTELADGIEGLYLKDISQADAKQRAGRAGRTKDGVYILCSRTTLDERPAFGKAEIERSRLDQLVLRLAVAGFDATELEFFHQPDRETLTEAKAALMRLGAMDDQGNVTETGKTMSRLPVDVHIARMIVEASKRGVVSDVIDIAACMEVGGIQDRKSGAGSLTEESSSDLLAELDIYKKALAMKDNEERQKAGIFCKAFWQAKEMSRRIAEAVYRFVDIKKSTGDREQILKSCVAGMVDHLFHKQYDGYHNGGNGSRELEKKSVLNKGRGPEWITGLPWDLEVPTRRGGKTTLHLVNWVSKVDPMWLVEIAPQLSKTFFRNYRYDSSTGEMTAEKVMTFNNAEIKEERIVVEESSPDAIRAFAKALADGGVVYSEKESNDQMLTEVKSVWARGAELNPISQDQLVEFLISRLGEAYKLSQLEGIDLKLTDRNISEILGVDYPSLREMARQLSPDCMEIDGQNFLVKYSRDSWSNKLTARIELPESFVRAASSSLSEGWILDKFCLPSGQQVELVCAGMAAITFSGLFAKLETARIEKSWSQARKANERASWMSKVDEVFPLLPSLLTKIEVAKDSAGNSIYGYFSLYSDSDPDFQIRLRESEDEASKETKIGLGRLLAKASKEALAVPKEEPYQTKDRWDDYKMSEIGIALKARFETLLTGAADLAPSTVIAKIDEIKVEAECIKAEVGGRFVEVQQIISEAEVFINTKVEGIDSDDRDLVSAEITQANESLKTAKESLKTLSYDEAGTACSKSRELVSNLAELIKVRGAGKDEAKTAWAELEDTLYNISYGRRSYDDVPDSEKDRASALRSEMSSALDNKQYDIVLLKAVEARQLLADIETLREAAKRAEEVLRKHLDEHYAKTPFYGEAYPREGGFATIYDNDPLYDGLKAAIDSAPDNEDTGKRVRLMESRLNGEVIIWLEMTSYNRDSVEFYLCVKEGLVLSETDLEYIEVVATWTAPDEAELRLIQLRREQENYLSEVERAEDNEWVIKLSFRLGENPKGGKQWEAGNKQVKYVVDRYSDFIDQVRENVAYYCYVGKTIVETGKFRVIAVKPYLQANHDFDAEIAVLEAELGVNAVDSEPDEEKIDLASALAGLKDNFRKK